MRAEVEIIDEPPADDDLTKALMRNVTNAFSKVVDSTDSFSEEIKEIVANIKEAGKLADMLAANLNIDIEDKQKVLETLDSTDRLEMVYKHINSELRIVKLGEQIQKDVRTEMDREQREYYLRQQIRAIQRELGEEDATVELDEFRDRRATAGNSIMYERCEKVIPIDDYSLMAIAGVPIPLCQAAQAECDGLDSLFRRTPGSGQDLAWKEYRVRTRPQVYKDLTRRCKGRGRDKGSSEDLCRGSSRQDHSGDQDRQEQQSSIHAR
jgi:hypothetical protein